MSVYIIVNLTIHDREAYERYARAFPPLFLQHGGEVLALQDAPQALEGSWPFDRTVILRMPSEAAMRTWYDSPEYQAVAEIRKGATESHIVVLPEFRMPSPRPGRN